MKKTLGIIGGMGPLATVKMFEKIVLYTDAKSDQEHIHVLIDNNTNIPDRTYYILHGGDSPVEQLLKSANDLESIGADFLIMPCNTAHYFYEDLKNSIGIPFLSMIEETAKAIRNNDKTIKKVGLLATEGTYKTNVYDYEFIKYGLEVVKPSEDDYIHIMKVIYNIKMGIKQDDLSKFYETMEDMKQNGVELFILGCTELSVAYEMYNLKGNFIDAMDEIAKSAIKFAGANIIEV